MVHSREVEGRVRERGVPRQWDREECGKRGGEGRGGEGIGHMVSFVQATYPRTWGTEQRNTKPPDTAPPEVALPPIVSSQSIIELMIRLIFHV